MSPTATLQATLQPTLQPTSALIDDPLLSAPSTPSDLSIADSWTLEAIADPISRLSTSSLTSTSDDTWATALDLGILTTTNIQDFVGSSDRQDYYHFSLATSSDFSLSLTQLSADADVLLYTSAGILLDSSEAWGNTNETISLSNLAAGDYYVKVFQYQGDTTYDLNLKATALLPPNPSPNPSPNPNPTTLADWTFMVYLDGDNNLEAAAIEDFLEMSAVGSNANINIVVQFDRTAGYSSAYGNWTGTRRGLVQTGDLPNLTWGTNLGEVNMGAQSSLQDFVSWGMNTYQAQNYAVVLWNHGGGWNSIASDDTSWGDSLTANEVSGALSTFTGIDLIGADACLMGMTEFAYQLQTIAPILVASEELEPGDGWDYTAILQSLTTTPTMTASQLGSTIVNTYAAQYTAEYGSNSNQTLSMIDLTQIDDLAQGLSTLATTIMTTATPSDRLTLVNLISATPAFGGPSAYAYDYRDLGYFLTGLATNTALNSNIRDQAQSLLAVYNATVLANFAGAANSGATGLAIHLIQPGEAPEYHYTAANSTFAAHTQWDELLHWISNPTPAIAA